MTLKDIIDERIKSINEKRYTILDMSYVAEKIKQSIAENKEIFIVGDYDCDGVFSSAILIKTLEYVGVKKVKYHLPRRFSEGYGLNVNIIDEIDERSLLICVDNGIVAFEAVQKAKDKKCDVIIIDHHLRHENGSYPNADIIIDPNAIENQCEFTAYCGAGLSFKLAELLINDENVLMELKSLAAFGTIADCVSLTGENHLIAKAVEYGFLNIGLSALLNRYQIMSPNEEDAGFKICPTINAAGRLLDDGAELSLSLLLETNEDKICEIVDKLISLNEKRKILVEQAMEEVIPIIESDMINDNPICVKLDISEGIIGIVAGKIAERYNVPTFVFAENKIDENGNVILKGSARTAGKNNLKEIMDNCKEYLIQYGGHSAAAGLSLFEKDLKKFQQKASNCCVFTAPVHDVEYDVELKPVYVKKQIEEAIKELKRAAPYGQDNPKILFKIDGLQLFPKDGEWYKTMGHNNQYYKFFGRDFDYLAFDGLYNLEPEDFKEKLETVGYISENIFLCNINYQFESIFAKKSEKNKKKPNELRKKLNKIR